MSSSEINLGMVGDASEPNEPHSVLWGDREFTRGEVLRWTGLMGLAAAFALGGPALRALTDLREQTASRQAQELADWELARQRRPVETPAELYQAKADALARGLTETLGHDGLFTLDKVMVAVGTLWEADPKTGERKKMARDPFLLSPIRPSLPGPAQGLLSGVWYGVLPPAHEGDVRVQARMIGDNMQFVPDDPRYPLHSYELFAAGGGDTPYHVRLYQRDQARLTHSDGTTVTPGLSFD